MPIIKATYSDPDSADRALARLRQSGIAFTASFRDAPSSRDADGYLTHLSYPSTTPLSMAAYQFQPAMLVATNPLPPSYPRQAHVSINVARASLEQSLTLLRNSGAYSITQ